MTSTLLQSEKSKTIFFQSLGCVKNLVDTEVMLGISLKDGYQLVTDPALASVIVVNTCSFIEASKTESIDTILSLSQFKDEGSCKRLIVTGCLPQRYKADLKVALPEVDAFVGTGQYADLLNYVEGKADDSAGFKHPKYIHSENTPRMNTQPFFRAYLKISEGCIKNCAFCIIPKIRGTLRSRSIESLRLEAARLVNSGVVELNLIAQDLTDYGRDLRDGSNLATLLKSLVTIDGLKWIRLLYLYPDDLEEELLALIAGEEKICKYIDTPIQHINDRMLKLMNRRVTGSLIRSRLEKLRNRIPNVSIRSTVIVGYPGETNDEYEELKKFVQETQLDHLGVFAYSHEENTASFSLPNQIDRDTKEARRTELLELQQGISFANCKQKIGQTHSVLIETQYKQNVWQGRYSGQAPDVDGMVLVKGSSFDVGSFVNTRVTSALEYDLIGLPLIES